MSEPESMPLTSHLEELRSRLVKCAIAIGVGFLLSYAFKQQIFDILTAPLVKAMQPGDHLIYTNLPEAFFTFLKAAFISALMLASPVILYQFWMFVAPGLYDKEKRLLMPIVLLSTIFFVGGALFGYFVVFPFGFDFFLSFASDTIRPMPSMKEYLGFSSKLLLAFGLVFEMPLVLTFLARLGIVPVKFLKKNRKYAILIFFLGAAIITPPDVVTQIFMALPLMLLYEISIIGATVFGRKKPKDEDEDEDGDGDGDDGETDGAEAEEAEADDDDGDNENDDRPEDPVA